MKTTANENRAFLESAILEKDEKVLWEGRPQNIKMFEGIHTPLILLRWAISLVILGATAWYWVYANAMEMPKNVIASVLVLGTAWGVSLAIRPFTHIKNLQSNIHYVVTNKRVISYKRKNTYSLYVQSRKFEDLTEATIIKKENGYGDLYIGPMTTSIKLWARHDLSPIAREDDYIKPLVFYNIYLPEEAAICLPSTITVNNMPKGIQKNAA